MAVTDPYVKDQIFAIVAESYDTIYDVCLIISTRREWITEKHFLNIENVPSVLERWTLDGHVSVVCQLMNPRTAAKLMYFVRSRNMSDIAFDGLAYANLDANYFRATWASYLHNGCELATTNATIMFVEFLAPSKKLLVPPEKKETIYIVLAEDKHRQRTIAVGSEEYGVLSSCYFTTHTDVVNILSPWLSKSTLYDFVVVGDFSNSCLISAIDFSLQRVQCTIINLPWRIVLDNKTKLLNFERYYYKMKEQYRCILAHMLLEDFFINTRLVNAIKS